MKLKRAKWHNVYPGGIIGDSGDDVWLYLNAVDPLGRRNSIKGMDLFGVVHSVGVVFTFSMHPFFNMKGAP